MNTMNFGTIFTFTRRALAVTALIGGGCLGSSAQQADGTSAPAKLDLRAPVIESTAEFSSSSADNDAVVAANHFDFVDVASAMQPPPRRYGRPRYRGSNSNPDGSPKYTGFAGVGLTQPVGNTYHYFTPSYSFQVGGGRNFNKNFGMMLQFDWDNFGFNGRTLASQQNLYNQIIALYNQQHGTNATGFSALDGNSHVWSFSLNPIYNIRSGEGLGAYVVGGVGFYHKSSIFTTPATGTYCDPFYGVCYQYVANQTIDHYTSNAPGFNGGFGLTYKISKFSNQRFYGEVRYQYIFNKQRAGINTFTVNSSNYTVNNDFPANSNRTSYIPVKFGIRF